MTTSSTHDDKTGFRNCEVAKIVCRLIGGTSVPSNMPKSNVISAPRPARNGGQERHCLDGLMIILARANDVRLRWRPELRIWREDCRGREINRAHVNTIFCARTVKVADAVLMMVNR